MSIRWTIAFGTQSLTPCVNIVHIVNMVHEHQHVSRRERKRAARIQGIVDTAMKIATSEGLGQVTTHRLARELDIAVGALYRYFDSKAAIIEAMQARALADYGGAMRRALKVAAGWVGAREIHSPPLTLIVCLGLTYRRLVEESPEHFYLHNQIMGDPKSRLPGAPGDRVVREMLSLFEGLSEPFDRAQKAGDLSVDCSPTESVLLFWSALRGILSTAKLEAHSTDIVGGQLFLAMLRVLLVGLGANAVSLEAAISDALAWQEECGGSYL